MEILKTKTDEDVVGEYTFEEVIKRNKTAMYLIVFLCFFVIISFLIGYYIGVGK